MIAVDTVLHETYRIERPLGEGGMGTVYLASHVRLPKRVAIKVLHPSVLANPESYARFRREAEIASSLGHPHIVEVQDFNTTDGGEPYIVMELLEGEDLSRVLLREGPMSVARVLTVTRAVGGALAAAHGAGIIHRDLKPQNIFVARKGGHEVIKIVDFGISKITGATDVSTLSSDIMGTPAYMSPEQALGKSSQVDGRADQFALGCIVYEMLSGRHAFTRAGDTLYTILHRIIHDDPEPLVGVPALWPAIARALQKSPAGRFADVSSFVAALEGDAAAGPDPALAATTPVPRSAISEPRIAPGAPRSATVSAHDASEGAARDASPSGAHHPGPSEARDTSPSHAQALPPGPLRGATPPTPPTDAVALAFHTMPRPRPLLTRLLRAGGVVLALLVLLRVLKGTRERRGDSDERPRGATSAPATEASHGPASRGSAAPAPRPRLTITLSLQPADASVFVDGEGLESDSFELDRGQARPHLRVTAAGYLPQELDVPTDEDRTVAVALVPAPLPPAATARPPRVRPRPGSPKKPADDLEDPFKR